MKILISACLLGVRCRYDGGSNRLDFIDRLAREHELIPVCPEQLGGLATPRESAEIRGGGVFTKSGADVSASFERGAEEALRVARSIGCRCALLKERSPSCGSGEIYDGSFTRTLTAGDGVTAALLKASGIRVIGESRAAELLDGTGGILAILDSENGDIV